MDDWLTVKEAAALGGVSEQRVRDLAGRGRFAGANRKARSWLIPRAAFQNYLDADRDRRRTADTPAGAHGSEDDKAAYEEEAAAVSPGLVPEPEAKPMPEDRLAWFMERFMRRRRAGEK